MICMVSLHIHIQADQINLGTTEINHMGPYLICVVYVESESDESGTFNILTHKL